MKKELKQVAYAMAPKWLLGALTVVGHQPRKTYSDNGEDLLGPDLAFLDQAV